MMKAAWHKKGWFHDMVPGAGPSNVGSIFVKNLDTSIDIKALYDTFSRSGNILLCKAS